MAGGDYGDLEIFKDGQAWTARSGDGRYSASRILTEVEVLVHSVNARLQKMYSHGLYGARRLQVGEPRPMPEGERVGPQFSDDQTG